MTRHDTTWTTLAWALHIVAKRPQIQSRLRMEILDTVIIAPSSLTVEAMDSMTYLHCMVLEVIRLFPAISATLRETREHTIIENTLIAKGNDRRPGTKTRNQGRKTPRLDQCLKPAKWMWAVYRLDVMLSYF
jgi:hypothetical protein